MKWIVLSVILIAACLGASVIWPFNDFTWSLRNRLAWFVQVGEPEFRDVMIPMPDGVRLATDIYLPQRKDPTPTVLMRLPYDKTSYGEVRYWVDILTENGFAVVAQDMRGRHRSEGVFSPYENAGPDGAATIDWIIAQSWSNGRVGTLGCSALGEAQLMLAAQAHPAHRAMVPISAGGAAGTLDDRYGFFAVFEGGILNLSIAAGWFGTLGGKTPPHSTYVPMKPEFLSSLPVMDIVRKIRADETDYDVFLSSFETPDYWHTQGYITGDEAVKTPALFIDTWHDQAVSATISMASMLKRARKPVSTIIAAGTHCSYLGSDEATTVGDLSVSPDRVFGFVPAIVRFLRHHLEDGPPPDLPFISYYALSKDQWRQADAWPPKATSPLQYYLSHDGKLVGSAGDIEPFASSFPSDPASPVPSIGGAICCTGNPDELSGPVFQNSIEQRDDVMILTSSALSHPTLIAGPLRAKLRVSATSADADLVLQLLDVDPEGRSLLVQQGALRLRYRNGFEHPELLEPGEIYPVDIDLRDISYEFKQGHRIRLHVAGSSFPRLARNLQTGEDNYLTSEMQKSVITLYSTPEEPSELVFFSLPE